MDGATGIEEIHNQFFLAAPSSADSNSTQQPAKVGKSDDNVT